MLYLKEDDMDEMMRKAAENYEVDAEGAADWQAVYKAVHESEDSPPPEEKKKKRRFAFWWLLLIPLGWIANTEYNKFNDAHTKQVNSSEASQTAASKANSDNQQASSAATPDLKTNDAKDNNMAPEKNNTKAGKQSAQFSLKHFKANANSYVAKQSNSNSNLNNDNNNAALPTQQPVNNEPLILSQSTVPGNISSNDNNNSINKSPDQPVTSESNNALPALTTDTSTHHNSNVVASKPSIKNEKTNPHYFYAGLIAGADLSFIKYQQAQPLGYNVGLLVGYKFNKRLSVESGFYLAKKNYYTKGEYFDKSNLHYFNDKEIINVNGYCNMFEIPLNIKYDIITRKKHTFFATIGLSSYLMNKEFYNFEYIDTAGEQHTGSAPYYHTTQNWFSVLNLSAGYELKTGNKTNIRIEPYYKASLTGVGTGNLSISSLGINAGIVRQIP